MMNLSAPPFNTLFGIAICLLAITINPVSAAGKLNVYNWAEYIGETTIKDFEAESGAKVTYDFYDSMEMVDSKLLTGASGYDVVSHNGLNVSPLDQRRHSEGTGQNPHA